MHRLGVEVIRVLVKQIQNSCEPALNTMIKNSWAQVEVGLPLACQRKGSVKPLINGECAIFFLG